MSGLRFGRLVSATGACLIAMGGAMAVTAPPASAATVNITIPDVTGAAPVSLLDTGGITFSGPSARTCLHPYGASDRIYVEGSSNTNCASGGSGGSVNAALTINVPGGEGITFAWLTTGLCGATYAVTFKLAGATVGSGSLSPCLSGNFTRSLAYDEVVIQASVADLLISSLSITYDPSSASSTTNVPPTAPMQGVPLPASGQCSDVVERGLDWASDISGGWSKSWQSWQVSSDANAPRWQGWACIRTLIWTSRGWLPSSA
jgi:hypothetical protein